MCFIIRVTQLWTFISVVAVRSPELLVLLSSSFARVRSMGSKPSGEPRIWFVITQPDWRSLFLEKLRVAVLVKKVRCVCWTNRFCYCVHTSLRLVRILSQMNPIMSSHNIPLHCFLRSSPPNEQHAGHSHSIETDSKSFESAADFKYLGTTLTNQNCIHEEIKEQMWVRERLLLFSRHFPLLSKNACIEIYRTLI